MTSTRPPRAPLPDWSDGIREGTASLTVDPEDISRPLAMGTSEDATGEGLALPPVDVPAGGPRPLDRLLGARPAAPAANDFDDDGEDRTKADDQPAGALLGGAAAVDSAEDRTKVDVRLMRPRPPRKGTQADDDGLALVGTTLGSYRLLARIGKGGMGFVYRAEHVRLGREVALKLLRQDYAKRKDAVARFFQEARTVNRVRHRNIVDVTDFVELDDGTTFILMELLTGQSLSSWVKSGIEIPRALSVLAQICDGLGAAHSVSVVHRDLKPDNVIITRDADGAEVVKLLDFGVAKLINQGDDDFGVETAAGSVVGTPAYMSPEQAGGLPIDGRSDIYSLGAIMYELFSGQPMFRGRSFGEFVRKHLTEQPPPPRSTPRGARLDPRIEQIILRAIEKEPSRRYQAVTELRDALLTLLGDYQALNQSGQRHLQPLPGESARIPAIHSGLAGAASHPGMLPPRASSPHLPAPMLPRGSDKTGSGTGRSTGGAPLVDITMESEEHSRSGQRMGPPSGYGQQSTHMVRTMPWYVWFAGGALAVGLGIGGATWYALSTEAKPAVAQAAMPAAALVEIRLTSEPSGAGVYKEGGTTELCRTPCALNLDPAEFGGITVRPFVLRREGFADANLVVDLRAAEREFKVPLTAKPSLAGGEDPATPVEPTPAPDEPIVEPAQPEPTSGEPTTSVEPQGTNANRPQPGKPRKQARGTGSSTSGDSADFEMPAAGPGDAGKPVEPVAKPTEAKPTPDSPNPGKTGKIDRSETIDPFRSRP